MMARRSSCLAFARHPRADIQQNFLFPRNLHIYLGRFGSGLGAQVLA